MKSQALTPHQEKNSLAFIGHPEDAAVNEAERVAFVSRLWRIVLRAKMAMTQTRQPGKHSLRDWISIDIPRPQLISGKALRQLIQSWGLAQRVREQANEIRSLKAVSGSDEPE